MKYRSIIIVVVMTDYNWENAYNDMRKNSKTKILNHIYQDLVIESKNCSFIPSTLFIDHEMIKEITLETKEKVIFIEYETPDNNTLHKCQLKEVYDKEVIIMNNASENTEKEEDDEEEEDYYSIRL